jgi:hypothetical protein
MGAGLMSGRLEYKYLVPNGLVDEIRADLQPYMEVDEFAGKHGEYTVRSVYYDTPGFDCYHEKLAGLKARTKFRIRGYDRPDDGSIVFLEIKRKNGGLIAKNRAPLLYRDLDSFFASRDFAYIRSFTGTEREQRDASRFLYHFYGRGLRPAVLVVYDREAFHGRFDRSLRLTLDKNLRGAIFPSLRMLYDEGCLNHAMARHFVLEVKFFRGTLPAWVRAMIGRYDLPRMALSKFTICLDAQDTPRKASRMRSGVPSPVSSMM